MHFTYTDETQSPRVDAVLVRGDRARVNRALAERLAVVHRIVFHFEADPPSAAREFSPEEKLLRAIFGERADASFAIEIGAEVTHGVQLAAQHGQSAHFHFHARAKVVDVQQLAGAEGCTRFVVTVEWPGPLEVGDELLSLGASLGIVEDIVEDGASEPRVYSLHTPGPRPVERKLPSARQELEVRSIGPYDLVTQAPSSGQVLRDDQLAWLVEAGGRSIVSEIAVYMNDPVGRTRVYESLVKLAPIVDGWRDLHRGET